MEFDIVHTNSWIDGDIVEQLSHQSPTWAHALDVLSGFYAFYAPNDEKGTWEVDDKIVNEETEIKSNGMVECPICCTQFNTMNMLEYHIKVHMNNYYKESVTNNNEYNKDEIIEDHSYRKAVPYKNILVGSTPYLISSTPFRGKVHQCDEKFFDSNYLKKHSLAHISGGNTRKSYGTYSREEMENVMAFIKDGNTLRTAEKAFGIPKSTIHLWLKKISKPYRCLVCGECFPQRSNLKVHERTHTGEKPYQCSVCGKCFTQSCGLKIHERTHTGEKPHQCSVCGKCYTQSGGLKVHVMTHTGEKPYKIWCMKCFKTKGELKNHERIHNR